METHRDHARRTPAALWLLLLAVPWSALLALPALFAGGCQGEPAERAQPARRGTHKPRPKAARPPAGPRSAPSAPAPQPPPALTALAPRGAVSPFEAPATVDAPAPAVASPAEPTTAEEPGGPPPAPDFVPSPEQVSLARFVLAEGVVDREPVGASAQFSTAQDRIFAFLHFENPDAPAYQVSVHFEPADGPPSPYGIPLEVGGHAPRWRTWAFTRLLREPGTYRAVVRNARGEELASREFEIMPPDDFR